MEYNELVRLEKKLTHSTHTYTHTYPQAPVGIYLNVRTVGNNYFKQLIFAYYVINQLLSNTST